jgi:hypothetical protein
MKKRSQRENMTLSPEARADPHSGDAWIGLPCNNLTHTEVVIQGLNSEKKTFLLC